MDGERSVRRLLLWILLLGMAGTLAELFLLGHTESWTQLVPLVALAAGIAAAVACALWPGRRTLLVLRGIMLAFVLAGAAGLYLHYRGNAEFELERHRNIRGMELFRRSMTGATPALAPGALILLALVGLVYVMDHPRLHDD